MKHGNDEVVDLQIDGQMEIWMFSFFFICLFDACFVVVSRKSRFIGIAMFSNELDFLLTARIYF